MAAILGQLADKNHAVRCSAAAAIIRLSTVGELLEAATGFAAGTPAGAVGIENGF